MGVPLRTTCATLRTLTASEIIREKGLGCLLYLVRPDNLDSITRSGILPYNTVRRLGLVHTSIANETIQQRRDFSISGDSLFPETPVTIS